MLVEGLRHKGLVVVTERHGEGADPGGSGAPRRTGHAPTVQNSTSLGQEYFSTDTFTYRSGWNDQIALTKRPYTFSDLIAVFSAAGLWIETAMEPQLSEDARRRYPHKQAWMDKYLGILIFTLRPHARTR